MPTRSGLDHQTINPTHFICAYCYTAHPNHKITRFSGMVTKMVQMRIDDSTNDFEFIPGEYTDIWTEPHCYRCHRQVLGYPRWARYPRRYSYE